MTGPKSFSASCAACPLSDRPSVSPTRAPSGGLAIVGEAPGQDEVRQGHPFVGRSGQLLRATLDDVGVDPSKVWITNACLCHPEKNATPTEAMIGACRARLVEELKAYRPSAILVCGNTAVQALIPGAQGITKIRGTTIRVEDDDVVWRIVPTFHPAAILRNPEMYKTFHDDVGLWYRLGKAGDRPEPPEGTGYDLIRSVKGLEQLLKSFRLLDRRTTVSCDLETTGVDSLTDSIVTIGVAIDEISAFIVDCRAGLLTKPRALKALRALFALDLDWVSHNGPQFDCEFLRAVGIQFTPRFDTMLASYALDERQGTHSLKTLAAKYFLAPNYANIDFKTFDPTDEKQFDDLCWYHTLDCTYTWRLSHALTDELDESDLLKVHDELLLPASFALATVERTGIKINREYLQQVDEELERSLLNQLGQLKVAAGDDNFNPNSPKQVSALLCDRLGVLPRGASTGKEILEPLEDKVPAVKMILKYRLDSKLQSTYVRGLMSKADVNDRVHADFLLIGTETGRLSARNPNLQNVPQLAGPVIRRAFIAENDDWIFGEADYSQLELRIAAYYSRDEFLLKAYHEGLDVHTLVASEVYHVPFEEVTFEQRYTAKYIDFGIIYGRSAHSLAHGELKCSVADAQRYIDNFLGRFRKLREWIFAQQKLAISQGFVTTPFGRRRRFPLVLNDNIAEIERQAVNTPIQSLASDVCLTALTRLVNRLNRDECRIVSTVHDSILFECRRDCRAKWLPIIRAEMEDGCTIPITDVVPLKADLKMGASWGDAKGVTWDEALDL